MGGLRQIRLLNVSGNVLVTLEEGAFHSVNTLETLRVDGNPLACDCRLLWILQRRKTLNFDGRSPVCAGPVEVQGHAITSFSDSALFDHFTCQKPRIRNRKLQQVGGACRQWAGLVDSGWGLSTVGVDCRQWAGGLFLSRSLCPFESIYIPTITLSLSPSLFRSPSLLFSLSQYFHMSLYPHLVSLCLSPQVSAREGQVVSFSCHAEGEPAPVIFWISPQRRRITTRSGGRVTVLAEGTLEIRYAQVTDTGTYICIASNAGGNDTYFATLTVSGLPPDAAMLANRTFYTGDLNETNLNDTRVFLKFTLDLKTILISTAMGCIMFLGVVVFCFLLLFVWSRGRGQHKNNFSVEYSFRKVDGPSAGGGQGGARKFNMKMI